jgi:hypothetical protein
MGTTWPVTNSRSPMAKNEMSAGPPGKTKKITRRDVEDTSNEMGAYMVVRAVSHESAAKLFENHPHYTIFPGESVEVMPVLPIPA